MFPLYYDSFVYLLSIKFTFIAIYSNLKSSIHVGCLSLLNRYFICLCFKTCLFQMLMFDFSHHNIEMACALLESAGRFLYRSPDSHHRTKVYLVSPPETLCVQSHPRPKSGVIYVFSKVFNFLCLDILLL